MLSVQRVFITRDTEHVNYLRGLQETTDWSLIVLEATPDIISKFKEWLKLQKEIAIDVETTHFDPYCGELLLTSFYAGGKVFTFDNREVPLTEICSTETLKHATITAHNLKFETLWFLKENIHFKKSFCTMLAEQKMLAGSELLNNIVDVLKRRGLIIPE